MQQSTKIRLAKALASFAREDLAIVLCLNGLCLLLALNLTKFMAWFIVNGATDMQQILGQRAVLACYLAFAFVLLAKTCSLLVSISADTEGIGLSLPEPAPTLARGIFSTVVGAGIVLGFWLILRYKIPFDNDLSWTIVPAVFAGSLLQALFMVLRRYQKTALNSDAIDDGSTN